MLEKKISKNILSMLKSGRVDQEFLNKFPKESLNDLTMLLLKESVNFYKIIRNIKPKPGSIPLLEGFDIYGDSKPYNGIAGGDHIAYGNFKERLDIETRIKKSKNEKIKKKINNLNYKDAILILDVSGHDSTDAVFASQFHHAFWTAADYEIHHNGDITSRIFDKLTTRFARTSRLALSKKYITAQYLEINQNGMVCYISAGHPVPIYFSGKEKKIIDIGKENKKTGGVIGFMPSKNHPDAKKIKSIGLQDKYAVNKINLEKGDILIMYTDGLLDIDNGSEKEYFKVNPESIPFENTPLEQKIKEVKNLKARTIWKRIYADILRFQPNLQDDLSYVIIKREY